MLRQLDTLIGFVVVMSIVSLMITIITQAVSSALGLRGQNLADALEAMIHKIDPDIGQQIADLPNKLVNEVLTRPVISDSNLSMSKNWPIIWKRATAIRPDELLQISKDIAGTTALPAGAPTTASEAAAKLLASLSAATPATMAALEALNAQLPALAAQKGTKLIQELNTATDVTLENLEKWFNSAQDRAQQWFTMHTRVVTIIASVVVAFVLQLDTFETIKHISSDPDIRSKLVTESDTLQKQTEGALGIKETDETARKELASLVDRLGTVGAEYNKTGLDLLPEPYPTNWGRRWSWTLSHLVGILASAALLSLGVPFWFNTLKSLASLRPMLANEVDKNPKQIPETTES